MPQTAELDCIIIGGGPAGISCALELTEHKHPYVLLENDDQLGGQLDQILNTIRKLAAGFFENWQALRQEMCALAERRNLTIQSNRNVTKLDAANRVVWVGDSSLRARTIVVATGASMRKLDVAEADRFSDDIFYRTELVEDRLYGHALAVVGGGDSALMEAMTLAAHCPRVYLIHRSTKFNARADVVQEVRSNPRIEILPPSTISQLRGDEHLCEVAIKFLSKAGAPPCRSPDRFLAYDANGARIAIDRLVVKIGYQPHTELLAGQVNLDSAGFAMTDTNCETSAPYVYAVGDITHPAYLRIAQ